MNTVPADDPHPRRARVREQVEHRARHSCGACGQAFTLHYRVAVSEAPAPSRVPCMTDGCGTEIAVLLPPHAFAVWTEEF